MPPCGSHFCNICPVSGPSTTAPIPIPNPPSLPPSLPPSIPPSLQTHEALEVASVETVLAPVFKEAVVALPVPKEAVNGRDGVFIIAFLPNFPGVEDRVYQVGR
jgi:hypothetical protein